VSAIAIKKEKPEKLMKTTNKKHKNVYNSKYNGEKFDELIQGKLIFFK